MYSWNEQEIEENILNLIKLKDIKTLKSYEQILKKLKEEEYDSKEYIMKNTLIKTELEQLKQYFELYPSFFDKKIIFITNNIKKLKYVNTESQKEIIKTDNHIIDTIYKFITQLDKEYKKILEDLINTNSIYIKNSNTDNQTFTLNDETNKKTYIYTTKNNTIKDIYKLTHELFHVIQIKKQKYNDNEVTELTNETIPLLSSFLLNDYLENYKEETYIEKNDILKNIIIMSQLNTEKLNILDNEIHTKKQLNIKKEVLTTDYLENTKYTFSYFLAFELYKKYKQTNNINTIKKFIEHSLQNFKDIKKYNIDFFDIASEKSRKQIKILVKK